MPYLTDAPHHQHSHATGTLIELQDGLKPVEDLRVGDMVRTKDNGFQPVRWVASVTLTADDFTADPALRPIRIRAGALGPQKPVRDLVVSQQHCVLIDDWRAELLFGEDEVLAPAVALMNDSTVVIDRSGTTVTYYHFMFDQHEIVYSNGVETESFHPSANSIDGIDALKRAELFDLFPQLEVNAETFGPRARATLHGHEVDVLMAC